MLLGEQTIDFPTEVIAEATEAYVEHIRRYMGRRASDQITYLVCVCEDETMHDVTINEFADGPDLPVDVVGHRGDNIFDYDEFYHWDDEREVFVDDDKDTYTYDEMLDTVIETELECPFVDERITSIANAILRRGEWLAWRRANNVELYHGEFADDFVEKESSE